MYNTYISSSISLRTKGSLSSFSYTSDYSYYLRNERFEKTPLSSSSSSSSCQSSCCCTCCAYCIQRVPINPSLLLYGLSQSTLIQWSPFRRRLVLGGGDQYCNRLPVYGVDRDCYGVSCYVKERGVVGGRRGRRVKGRFGCMDSEEKSKCRCSGGETEADVMLSLLTEEVVGEECFRVRERDVGSSKRVQVVKRGNVDDQCYRRKKKNLDSGYLKSSSKCELESVTTKLKKEGYKRNVEKEGFSRSENRRARTGGSSSSSYYSVSSSGDLESQMEVKAKNEVHVVDSSNCSKTEMRRTGEGRAEVEVVEGYERQRDDKEESGGVSKQQTTAVGSYVMGSNVEWDLRKKSEKKLSEVFIEQNKCVKESSQEASLVTAVQGSGSRRDSVSKKRFDDTEEKLTLTGNWDEERKKQYSQVIGESVSRLNYRQETEVKKLHESDAQMISSSQKQLNARQENVSAAVNLVQETKVTGKDETTNNSQQLVRRLKILNTDLESASDLQRQSETKMKSQEEKSTLDLSSVEGQKEQLHQTGEWSMGQIGSRNNSHQITDVSYGYDEKISTSHWQSEARMKNWEESSNLISTSHPEAKEQSFHPDRNDSRRSEHRKELQDAIGTSVVHVSNTEKFSNSTRVSEKRMGSQESYLASAMKLDEETTDGHNQTDEIKMQIGSRKEPQRPTKVSTFRESTSEEASSFQASLKASSFQASLNLVSQSRVQQVRVQDIDKRSSQAMLIPPAPPQVEARVSLQIEGTARLTSEEASRDTSEKESSSIHVYPQGKAPALHDEVYGGGKCEIYAEPVNPISHEDALGSADRLEKSSMHFVEDFVEKVRREVSTSEIIKEKNLSKTKSEYESEKQMQKAVIYGSEEIQEKELHSRRSSGVSRTKGPSDEMWDAMQSSIQGPSKTETPEGSTSTGNTIARRSSKTLWSIIADVVRFRWVPHSENQTSAKKSSIRSSSNESVSSEAWYSGHEVDEDNNENVKREKRSRVQSTSSDKAELGTTPMRSQEASDTMSAKDVSLVRAATSSSSSILESGSTSLGTSLVPGEENLSSSENGKSVEGTPSSTAIVKSSLPSSSRQLRRSPAVDEFSGTGRDDVAGSHLMEQQELPQSVRLTEVTGTEGKDGELKRRKLQRNMQVPRDNFDEWEEAFNHERELRKIDEMFMREALLEAKKAADTWEVPVGAVLVQHGKIIARGFNLVEELRDSTAHAEMICIREASNVLQTWRLAETTLYVTLEPCPMCAGAILQARIDTVVWGAPNKLLGADGSWIRLFPNGEGGNGSELTDKPPPPVHPFHPKLMVRRGVLASECADAMKQFFQLRRRKEKTPDPPTPPTPPSRLHVSNHPSKILTKMHNIFNVMFCL